MSNAKVKRVTEWVSMRKGLANLFRYRDVSASALRKPSSGDLRTDISGFTPTRSDRGRMLEVPVDCGSCFKSQCPLGHWK